MNNLEKYVDFLYKNGKTDSTNNIKILHYSINKTESFKFMNGSQISVIKSILQIQYMLLQ